MPDVTIDLSHLPDCMNDVFYPILAVRSRFLILMGGAGSGKSMAAGQKMLIRLVTEPGQRLLCVRKVARTLRASVYPQLLDTLEKWNLNQLCTFNRTEMSIKFRPNGSSISCIGLDDPEKLKSIYGIGPIWVEEPTELTAEDFQQLNLRLRGKSEHYKQIILSFNPISETHWLRKMFFDGLDNIRLGELYHGSRKDSVVLRTNYKYNQFLDANYKGELEALRDQDYQLYRIYALGDWGVLKGLIFRPPIMESVWPESFDRVIYGLDFGYNAPSALVQLGLKGSKDIYLDELLYKRHLTNTQLLASIKDLLRTCPNGRIYADSAEPDRIREGKAVGLPIYPMRKDKNSVTAGIDLLKSKILHTHSGNTNLNAEFATYKWKASRDGSLESDQPVKYNDHAIDAIRGALYTAQRHTHHLNLTREDLGI